MITKRIHLFVCIYFTARFLPFMEFYLTFFSTLYPSLTAALSSELKKIHPHRSLGRRAGRRHSTAGGRNVSRQYVSHFDRNTDRGHQASARWEGPEVAGEGTREQDDPTGIRPTRVSPCTTIEFMTFWSHDCRCVEHIPSSRLIRTGSAERRF